MVLYHHHAIASQALPEIKEIHARNSHTLINGHGRHECDPANSDEVITWQAKQEPWGCMAVKNWGEYFGKARGQGVQPACPWLWHHTQWITDTNYGFNLLLSFSWLLSTSRLTLTPVTFWKSLQNPWFSHAWTLSLTSASVFRSHAGFMQLNVLPTFIFCFRLRLIFLDSAFLAPSTWTFAFTFLRLCDRCVHYVFVVSA